MSNQATYQTNIHRSDEASGHHSSAEATNTNSHSAPNVRHIPIFVEGRDEPLINRSKDSSGSSSAHSPNQSSSHYQSNANQHKRPSAGSNTGGHFDWSRKFSSMGGQQSGGQQQAPRSDSPHQTVPMTQSAPGGHQSPPQRQQPHQYSKSQTDGRASPPPAAHATQQNHSAPAEEAATNPDLQSISKIQKIQRDVLALMDQVRYEFYFN